MARPVIIVLASVAATCLAAPPQLQQFPKGWTAVRGLAGADPAVSHAGKASLRLESDGADAAVQSPALALAIGKRYELTAWVRTDRLAVTDTDRTPVAIGAAVSMESAPFDVHSESVGGTRDWTRVRLRFTATRAQDRILLTAGSGGRFTGRAWFSGVNLEEIGAAPEWPVPAAVQRCGPAYRFPIGGWIYLHIEGKPYERGYQHGRLMAHEIPQYIERCAMELDPKAKERAWELGRTSANALFLRGFDREILEEMKGIADGAKDAGAKWNGRDIDLEDIVAANTIVELQTLRGAMPVTPTGLEGLKLVRPKYDGAVVPERCSAFAATGGATRDGKMVIGHITMWSLTLAEQTNVMLDIQPATGHRILMQSYPGGIESGTDYYQNDAGVVLTETTIRQSPFNLSGRPVAFRARKAIQYGDDVDHVVEYLGRDNNGLYTNEWLIGDAKNNEIAMFELGTYKTRLYRSSKSDWFGGTDGFYWGCNNAKDLNVRLEYQPDPEAAPSFIPYVPAPRDLKWQELYRRFKGRIDEQFGFLAFRTAPLVSSSAMDAKIATAGMAQRLMCWAFFGKPNHREWVASQWERDNYHDVGLYPGGYRLIQPLTSVPGAAPPPPSRDHQGAATNPYKDRLWKGWILPASDADLWLAAGSAAYYRVLRAGDWQQALENERAAYSIIGADQPLASLAAGANSSQWFELAAHKGALLFDALRKQMGDDRFFTLMRDFFRDHTTQTVHSADFLRAADQAAGKPLASFFSEWLNKTGAPAPIYLTGNIYPRLRSALLVYGTVLEAGANRYAAEQLQRRYLDAYESQAPIRKDFEVTADELESHDVIFVGRPETNSALAAWKDRLGLDYDGAAFRVDGAEHASGAEALMLAAANPLDRARMVLVVAGNSPLETVRLSTDAWPGSRPYTVYQEGRSLDAGAARRGRGRP